MRRILAFAASLLFLFAASGCGSDELSGGSEGSVTIVGQNFTEAKVMTELYKALLEDADYDVKVKNFGSRDLYLPALVDGDVQISADYLSSMTEALNRDINGKDADSVASPDVDETLSTLAQLGTEKGIEPLNPAQAEDANAYAVTKKFAKKNNIKTLSDLGKLGKKIALAANGDCAERTDCGKGLKTVYGIKLSKIEPLGFGSPDTKSALKKGEVQLGQVATTDGTLADQGLVILEDDKNWQNAENLVPVVNSAWYQENPEVEKVLNKLSDALTTEDLAALNAKVDSERMQVADVAEEFLKSKGLM